MLKLARRGKTSVAGDERLSGRKKGVDGTKKLTRKTWMVLFGECERSWKRYINRPSGRGEGASSCTRLTGIKMRERSRKGGRQRYPMRSRRGADSRHQNRRISGE